MLRPGDTPIPGYRLEKFLGKGQYGEVWRARSPGGASAALKFLDLSGRAGWKEFRGVQRVKAIRHANLMPITALWLLDEDNQLLDDDAWEKVAPQDTRRDTNAARATLNVDSIPVKQPRRLVVATLLAEKNLLERLEECKLQGQTGIPAEELLGYMDQAAKGIDYLNSAQHDLGDGPVAIQHCDIKPENIMLAGDSVMICDFGLANVLQDARSAATATGMVGSLAYMSPECSERKPGSASDQYSLAISYAELRTGELPFEDPTVSGVIKALQTGKHDLSRLSSAEQQIISRATAINPTDRYPSASEMVADLRRAVTGVKREPDRTDAWRWGLVAAALAFMVTLVSWRFFFPADPPLATLQVRVDVTPDNATLVVDGNEHPSMEQGSFVLELPRDVNGVRLQARAPDYQMHEEFIPFERLAMTEPISIALQRTAGWLSREAGRLLQDGDLERAVKMYAEAITADQKLAVAPPALAPHASAKVECFQWDDDSKYIVAGCKDGSVVCWELLDHGLQPQTILAPSVDTSSPVSNTVSDLYLRNRRLFAAKVDYHIESWLDFSPQQHRDPGRIEVTGTTIQLAGTDDQLAIGFYESTGTDEDEGRVRVVSATDPNKVLWEGSHSGYIERMDITADGQWLVTQSRNDVRCWPMSPTDRAQSGKSTPVIELESGDEIGVLAVGVDDEIICAGRVGSLADAKDEPEETSRPPGAPEGGAGSGSNFQLMILSAQHPEKRVAVWTTPHAWITSVAADPESGRLATGGDSTEPFICVWERTKETCLLVLQGHQDEVSQLTFFHQGKWIVSGDARGDIGLWDLEHPHSPLWLARNQGKAVSIRISPDQRWIAALVEDGIRIWPLAESVMTLRACQQAKVPPGQPPPGQANTGEA